MKRETQVHQPCRDSGQPEERNEERLRGIRLNITEDSPGPNCQPPPKPCSGTKQERTRQVTHTNFREKEVSSVLIIILSINLPFTAPP